jgi:hypothetical protein
MRKNFRQVDTCYTCKYLRSIESGFDNLYCGLEGQTPPEYDLNDNDYWDALENFLDNNGVAVNYVCDNYTAEEVN